MNHEILMASVLSNTGWPVAQGWFFSTNGGVSWFGSGAFPPTLTSSYGSPVAFLDVQGGAYYVTLGDPRGVLILTTTDFGTSWSTPSNADPLNSDLDDSPCATADPTGTQPNNVYCAWTDFNVTTWPVQFTRSTDRGLTWSQRTTFAGEADSGWGATLACGPAGEVYVAWAHYTIRANVLVEAGIGFAKSTDGGATFSMPRVAFAITGIRTSAAPPEFNSTRVNSFPKIAVDRSDSPRRGWIYITFADRSQGQSNIYLRRSSDGGATWSDTLRVNGSHVGPTRQAWSPSLAVDPANGDITASYYQFDSVGTNFMVNRYAAHSTDGGNTWERWVISDVRTLWSVYPCLYISGCTATAFDATALGGKAWIAWADKRTGQFQVWLERIEYPTASVSDRKGHLPKTFALEQNYPNPFNPRTTITFSVADVGTRHAVSLRVYDILGRDMATLVNEVKPGGEFSINFDASNLSSGVYLYRLTSGPFVETRKMILIR